MAVALVMPSYTEAYHELTYHMLSGDEGVRAVASVSLIGITAFGQPKRIVSKNNTTQNALQNALWSFGCK